MSNQEDTSSLHSVKQEKELISLVTYETIAKTITLEWNSKIKDIIYHISIQNDLKQHIETLQNTLHIVETMNSIIYNDRRIIVISVLNEKIKTFTNMLPQVEHVIQVFPSDSNLNNNSQMDVKQLNSMEENMDEQRRNYDATVSSLNKEYEVSLSKIANDNTKAFEDVAHTYQQQNIQKLTRRKR